MIERTRPALAASLALALSLVAGAAWAKEPSSTAGAGRGVLPSGAALNGVSLSALRFGMGVALAPDGTASGDFGATLLGTSGGAARNVIVDGRATRGSAPAPGRATFSGVCTVDMGDGSPPLSGVPFTVSAVAGVNGGWSLALSVGSTNLPAATGTEGRIVAIK